MKTYGMADILKRVAVVPSGCWLWKLAPNRHGYGALRINGRSTLAHRAAYEFAVGPIPEGLTIDHLCRVRMCVNPAHLEPVTRRENTLRGDTIPARYAARTACIHGHEYTPENTDHRPDGGRRCRACVRARVRTYRQKLSAARKAGVAA